MKACFIYSANVGGIKPLLSDYPKNLSFFLFGLSTKCHFKQELNNAFNSEKGTPIVKHAGGRIML